MQFCPPCNTGAPLLQELSWRSDEDSFPYRHDVIRTKNIEGGLGEKSSHVFSKQHPHELTSTAQSRRAVAKCNVCGFSGSCCLHCKDCDWDICTSCVRAGERRSLFLALTVLYSSY